MKLAVRSVGVEHTPIEADLLLAGPVQSSTGWLYVVAWRVPLLLPMSMVPVPARSFGVRLVLVIVVAGVVCWWLTRRFLLRSQQMFLADISQELRSPLVRPSLVFELAKRTLGRTQGQDRSTNTQRVDVRGLVRDVGEDADFAAQQTGKRVVLDRDCPAHAEGDPETLRGAIDNVVRSAVRYTPQSFVVRVALANNGPTGEISISVSERGPEVPAEVIGRIFDPFFRVEAARDRQSGGVDPGLAIAQEAMRMHGGSAHAEVLPHGGLRVTLALRAVTESRLD